MIGGKKIYPPYPPRRIVHKSGPGFFSNSYVKTIFGVILTAVVGFTFNHFNNKIEASTQRVTVDSTNTKNVRDQFWDLFESQADRNKVLQAEIDSIKDCCPAK